jgi:hypothetical protein
LYINCAFSAPLRGVVTLCDTLCETNRNECLGAMPWGIYGVDVYAAFKRRLVARKDGWFSKGEPV